MTMRRQTMSNRQFGITVGRDRRTLPGNREEISLERRSQVFRQDVDHAGNAGDVTRAQIMARARERLEAMEPTILSMRAAGATYAKMQRETKLASHEVAAILRKHGLLRGQGRGST